MPIYEYQCGECGHHLEALQKFSDAPLTDCPECQKPALSKQISATSFQLKGTGWYVTDTRDKGKPPAAKSPESSDSPASTNDKKTNDTSSGSSSSSDSATG